MIIFLNLSLIKLINKHKLLEKQETEYSYYFVLSLDLLPLVIKRLPALLSCIAFWSITNILIGNYREVWGNLSWILKLMSFTLYCLLRFLQLIPNDFKNPVLVFWGNIKIKLRIKSDCDTSKPVECKLSEIRCVVFFLLQGDFYK
jgi:hypothetical protein